MAGGHGDHHFHPVKLDPAIERWAVMRENVYQHFKFTRKTTRVALVWGIFVPFGLYYLLSSTNNRWDFAGKQRGQSLLRNPPKQPEPVEELE